jgi:hypothetical protein
MRSHSATVAQAWRLGQGPFIFHGQPPRCVGYVDFINESDEKVVVRSIEIAGAPGEKLPDPGMSEFKVGARLPPNARTRVQAHFRLDPRTPPGTYNLELSCGDQRERVVVHVWEKTHLVIHPGVVTLRGGGGDVLNAVVVISNEGNVTETPRELALVYLEEHEWLGRAQVFAMRETQKGEGMMAYLDRLIAELKDSMPREARVVIRTAISELDPGETREVELEIRLPDDLRSGRTYHGFAKFMSSELKFKLECNGTSHSAKRRPR